VTLHLYDWFLPALYQSGADISQLTDQSAEAGAMAIAPETDEGQGG